MLDLTLLICTIVILFFISLLVLFVNPKSKTNQYFSFWAFFLIVWIFSNYFENEPYFQDYRLLLLRIDFTAAILLGAFFYLFCLNFPQATSVSRQKKIIIYSPSILLSILSFTNLIIKDIHFHDNTIVFSQGYLFLPYFLFFISYIVSGCGELVLKYKKSIWPERIQIFYVVLGFVISAIIAVSINLILPLFVFIPANIARVGIYGILIFCIFTTLAITRHHLFGIRVILTELLVGVIGLILLIQALTALSFGWRILNSVIFIFFCVFAYYLVKATHQESKRREEAEKLTIQERGLRQESEKLAKEFKRLDRAKTQFLLATQHHLRTPLSIMKNYTSMILEGSYGRFEATVRHPLSGTLVSIERLIKLVNEFLDVSQLQLGKGILKKKKTNIMELLRETMEELLPIAREKRLYLKLQPPSEPLPEIELDQGKMKSAIFNIIDNSLKYTQKGGVTIRLKIKEAKLQIAVSDTGIGISKEDLRGLFEKTFERGEEAEKLFTTGRGIGLYISRVIIEAHQGKIWAESEGEGKGSTFYVELPMK